MGASKQPQMVLRHQAVKGFSDDEMAALTDDQTKRRYNRLANGYLHVSPGEAVRFSEKFGLPIQTLFDEAQLVHLNGPWPPRRGAGSLRDRLDAAEAELAVLRGDDGTAPREIVAPVGVSKSTTVMVIPDPFVDRVVAFLRGLDAS